MISGTPTALQRIAASMLVQKHVYLVPLAANLSARRSNAIEVYAFSRRQGFGKSSLARRLFLCTSILSAIQSVTEWLVKK